VRITLLISEGGETQTVDFPDVATVHRLPVLGLKPDRTYSVEVRAVPGGPLGTVFATTDPLPADFPSLVTHVSDPAAMEAGYTLIDRFGRGSDQTRPRWSIIVDSSGEVVWYTTQGIVAGRQLPNGDLIWRTNEVLNRMDMVGNVTHIVLQDPGLGLHHDLLPTPHGTYLSLTAGSVEVTDFPASYSDPTAVQTAIVRDESVVEFLPDGSLRREWPFLAMLDDHRIGYDDLSQTNEGLDWIHTNAVIYDPADDSIVVSARHQDAVIKFSRETGELIWILGNPENWSAEFQPYLLQPVGSPFRWQYHQHAPMWTGNGTLVLFDNGNRKASPFDGTTPVADPDNFSRGVEFEIDEDLLQVRQLWQYGEGADPRLYSFYISDADWQPITGNRLMVFGGLSYVNGVASADLGMGSTHVRVVEATNDVVPVVVFDLSMFDPAGGSMSAYRGERIPSLYPPQYIKLPNGVGATVRMDRSAGSPELSWTLSPVDDAHDPADYYIGYVSTSPFSGFAMFDSTATARLGSSELEAPLLFFKIVAANTEGTSGDEPAP